MISRNRASWKRAPAFLKSVHLHGFVNCPTVPQSRICPPVDRTPYCPIQTYFQTIEYFTVQRSRFAKEYIGFAVSITKSQEEQNEHPK